MLASVKRLSDAHAALRKQERALLSEIAKHESANAKALLRSGRNAWVHRATGGLDFLNVVVNEIRDSAVKEDSGIAVLASGEGTEGGPVMVVGGAESVADFVARMKGVVKSIKGGGKGEKWQGKVTAWGKGELEALRRLVEEI